MTIRQARVLARDRADAFADRVVAAALRPRAGRRSRARRRADRSARAAAASDAPASRRASGTTPACTNELLPTPDGPTTATNGSSLSRFTSASTSRSRPTNHCASRSVIRREPAIGRVGRRGRRAPARRRRTLDREPVPQRRRRRARSRAGSTPAARRAAPGPASRNSSARMTRHGDVDLRERPQRDERRYRSRRRSTGSAVGQRAGERDVLARGPPRAPIHASPRPSRGTTSW